MLYSFTGGTDGATLLMAYCLRRKNGGQKERRKMGMTVRFASGEKRQYHADAASLEDHERVFVLHKWNARKRKLESTETFLADEIAWARLPNGNIVLGKGQVKSK